MWRSRMLASDSNPPMRSNAWNITVDRVRFCIRSLCSQPICFLNKASLVGGWLSQRVIPSSEGALCCLDWLFRLSRLSVARALFTKSCRCEGALDPFLLLVGIPLRFSCYTVEALGSPLSSHSRSHVRIGPSVPLP